MDFRIGQSTDLHRLEEGYDLYLGGLKLDHNLGLVGHSDADVLLHAIAECLLGALGLGDLGTHFPDDDPKYKGISSIKLLEHVYKKVEKEGYTIVNIDSTIHAQNPKLNKYIQDMKKNVSKIINCSCINIKATTGEKIGIIGEEKAIMAEAICLIKKG